MENLDKFYRKYMYDCLGSHDNFHWNIKYFDLAVNNDNHNIQEFRKMREKFLDIVSEMEAIFPEIIPGNNTKSAK